jgi:hypothetical protein
MLFQKINEDDALATRLTGLNYVYFVLFGVLCVWLFDVFWTVDIETTKDINLKQEQLAQKKDNESPKSVSETSKLLANLASVTLPPVPVMSAPAAVEASMQTSNASILAQATDVAVVTHSPQSRAKVEKGITQATQSEVNTIIKQLTALNSQHIQFLLPASNSAKKTFLNHMYRCERMQFGALTNKPPFKLTLLSDISAMAKGFQASELLRVAHDYLNNYEQSLLTLYGQGKRPVRIFPARLDANLAAHIAKALGDSKLQSLSARYFVQGKQVGLTNIVLNEQVISENWLISSNGCE